MEWREKIRGRSGARPQLPGLVLLMLLAPLAATAEAGAPDPPPRTDEAAIQGRGEGFPMNDPSYRPPGDLAQAEKQSPPHTMSAATIPRSDAHNVWMNLSIPGGPPYSLTNFGDADFDDSRGMLLVAGPWYTVQLWALDTANRTWNNWTHPSVPPRYMDAFKVVVAEKHDNLVIFGGRRANNTMSSETWIVDLASHVWRNATKPGGPGPRSSYAAVYDVDSDRVVLHGGCTLFTTFCQTYTGDTWSFDPGPETWTRLSDIGGPTSRSNHELAYDPYTDRALAFGGYDGSFLFDTYLHDLDNNSWTRVITPKYPGGRYSYGLSFDLSARQYVLYGGWTLSASANNDTWTFIPDLGRWQEMTPATDPTPRFYPRLDYDPRQGITILHAGRNVPHYNDTWSYDLGNVSGPPRNISATGWIRQVNLSWEPPMDPGESPVGGYVVMRGTSPGRLAVVASPGNLTSYVDASPTAGIRYYYAIKANNSYGLGAPSAETPAVAKKEPSPPASLNAVGLDGAVVLDWSPPTDDGGLPVTAYRVHRGLSSGVYDSNFTIGNVTSYVDAGLVNSQTYYYAVSALNLAGEGPLSVETSALPSRPAGPVDVVATIPTDGETDVPLDAEIEVVFNVLMDPSPTAGAFLISPPVSGSIAVNGTTLRWTPGTGLPGNTTMTVSVSPAARSLDGGLLGKVHSFSFSTVPDLRTVSGRVTSDSGTPAAALAVSAHLAFTGAFVARTDTAADGSFSLRLEKGRIYYLEVLFADGVRKRSESFSLDSDRQVNVQAALIRAPVGPWSPPWLIIGIGLIGTLTALAAAAWLGGEAVLFALLVIPIILYSRIHREKVLDHFVRGQIYGHIKTNPGATFTEIGEILGVSNGVLTYHLYTLEKTEFIRSEREGRWKRFWPREAPKTKQGVMVSKLQSHILEMIKTNPGISQVELAVKLGTKRQNVNYNVQKLVGSGLVRLDGWGFRKGCVAVPPKEQDSVHRVEPGPKPVPDAGTVPKPPTK